MDSISRDFSIRVQWRMEVYGSVVGGEVVRRLSTDRKRRWNIEAWLVSPSRAVVKEDNMWLGRVVSSDCSANDLRSLYVVNASSVVRGMIVGNACIQM